MDRDWLLSRATCFVLLDREPRSNTPRISVERRSYLGDKESWAVVLDDSSVLSKKLKSWIYERLPSSRTEESLADTRWHTLAEAIVTAQAEVDLYRQMVELHGPIKAAFRYHDAVENRIPCDEAE